MLKKNAVYVSLDPREMKDGFWCARPKKRFVKVLGATTRDWSGNKAVCLTTFARCQSEANWNRAKLTFINPFRLTHDTSDRGYALIA
jgi:hypothetical protein